MADDRLDQALSAIQTPEAQAFLNTLAGPESGGRYNLRFDGGAGALFDDLSQHPRASVLILQTWPGPGAGVLHSDAAGKYQFLGSTWDSTARRLGLPGAESGMASFDPLSQDVGAWDNAAEAYRQQHPGRDMLADLKAGNVDQVMAAMRSSRQWDTANPQAYAGNLAKLSQSAQAGASDGGGRVMGSPQQDPWMAFINGTLKLPEQPQSGVAPLAEPASAVVPSAATDPAEAYRQANPDGILGPPGGFQGQTKPPAIPAGVAALAAAGKQPNAPPVVQAQPQTAAPAPPADAFGGPSVVQGQIDQIDTQLKGLAALPANAITEDAMSLYNNLLTRRAEFVKQLPVVGYQQKTAEDMGSKGLVFQQGPNGPARDQAGRPILEPEPGLLPSESAKAGAVSGGSAPNELVKVDIDLGNGQTKSVQMTRAQAVALSNQTYPGLASPQGAQPSPAVPMKMGGASVLTPEQTKISESYGTQAQAIMEAGNKAPDVLGKVQILRGAAQNFQVGATGPARLTAANYVKDVFNRIGIPTSDSFNNMVASGELIGKESGQLVADLVRSLGSREAFAVWNQVRSFMPHTGMSDGGFNALVTSIEQGALRDQKLHEFQDTWLSNHSSTAGMQSDFNKQFPIETFSSKVLPIPTDQAKGDFVVGATYKSPNGRVAIRQPDGTWLPVQ